MPQSSNSMERTALLRPELCTPEIVSHRRMVGQRGGEAEHLRDALAWELRILAHDVFVRHALGKAGQDERHGEAGVTNCRLTAETVGVRHEELVPRDRRVLHECSSRREDT